MNVPANRLRRKVWGRALEGGGGAVGCAVGCMSGGTISVALQRYAEERGPEAAADLVVRADDPRHPALVRPV